MTLKSKNVDLCRLLSVVSFIQSPPMLALLMLTSVSHRALPHSHLSCSSSSPAVTRLLSSSYIISPSSPLSISFLPVINPRSPPLSFPTSLQYRRHCLPLPTLLYSRDHGVSVNVYVCICVWRGDSYCSYLPVSSIVYVCRGT